MRKISAAIAISVCVAVAIVGLAQQPAGMPPASLPYQIVPIPSGIGIERDVMVAMPDGVRLAGNIFRPEKPGRYPVILSMTPYGKDQTPPTYDEQGRPRPGTYAPYVDRVWAHGADLGHMKVSMLTAWEAPDPAFWVPRDYAMMIVDRRGGFKSEGMTPTAAQQAQDIHRVIEWVAAQPWSNGNVGMLGVSALATNQFYAASVQPPSPHLKAIIPWEGQIDVYRDSMFWGGIPETSFTHRDTRVALAKLPADQVDKAWAEATDPVRRQILLQGVPKVELSAVPALIAASWSDKGLHTRGTFEAFRRIGSADKWLYTHGGKKWERFYSEDALAYQKNFFDHFLKGMDNAWRNTPKVRLEVRSTRDEYTVRAEHEFPLARTRYTKLYLDARKGSLSSQAVPAATATYHSTTGGDASFGMTFDRDTELTGYMKARLWVSAPAANDMDLFVAVKKFDAQGNEVQFRGMNGFSADMVAKGQMRVSLRELDPVLSTPWQPVQKFSGEKKLKPGEIVPVEIALLPSSTLFRKGDSLRVYVQGRHPVIQPLLFYTALINTGEHTVHTGGRFDTYLEVPVIP